MHERTDLVNLFPGEVQSLLNLHFFFAGATLVVSGDGRYYSKDAIQVCIISFYVDCLGYQMGDYNLIFCLNELPYELIPNVSTWLVGRSKFGIWLVA